MASLKPLLPCLVLMLWFSSFSEAREFLVGGQHNSWKIPSSPDEFNKWAEKNRFRIGDTLVLEYDQQADSVLEVTEADYKSCNKANPIKSFHDGKTKIELYRSGPFYFISGVDGHCEKGQKLEVQVLSAKHGGTGTDSTTHTPVPSPAPTPVRQYAPAPAPASGGYSFRVEGFGGLALFMATLAGFALVF